MSSNSTFETYYSNKEENYYSNVRTDVVKLLPKNENQRILEIGAGGGDTLRYIKEKGIATHVSGIELFKLENSNQSHPSIDYFSHHNIENQDLDLKKNSFDVIILADVLEHLNDPWAALKYLEEFLSEKGEFIVSLPNIREINAMTKIFFKGDFGYTSHGILDKTHLRFFCKKNMVEMLSSNSREILEIRSNLELRDGNRMRKLLNKATFKLFEEFLSLQFFFKVRPKGSFKEA